MSSLSLILLFYVNLHVHYNCCALISMCEYYYYHSTTAVSIDVCANPKMHFRV